MSVRRGFTVHHTAGIHLSNTAQHFHQVKILDMHYIVIVFVMNSTPYLPTISVIVFEFYTLPTDYFRNSVCYEFYTLPTDYFRNSVCYEFYTLPTDYFRNSVCYEFYTLPTDYFHYWLLVITTKIFP